MHNHRTIKRIGIISIAYAAPSFQLIPRTIGNKKIKDF